MFQPVDGNVNFPEQELAVGKFWKDERIYEKSLERRVGAPPFVFYEGPPTANGMPHPGHCLTRAIKDLFPRYKTMRGFRCERKAGWDTHGLPVEVEVCKELGIHSKEEIEAYGIEPFIQKCQQSVWRYMQEWERLTERIGFWVDLKQAYVTYHQSYVESIWWSLKNLFDRGLLYQGHKIVWWWAQGGTALSAGEVGQGYRQVADPSVYVKFPLIRDANSQKLGLGENASLLVWTTTPWTLPSNQFVAVSPKLIYSVLEDSETGELFIAASDLVEAVSLKSKRTFRIVKQIRGSQLIELNYLPPFDNYWRNKKANKWRTPNAFVYATELLEFTSNPHAQGQDDKMPPEVDFLDECLPSDGWQIVPADFVTTDTGTGLVHIAPAFGEDDMRVLERRRTLLERGPSLLNAVAPNGKFTDEAPEFVRGRWVKDCDKDIVRDLKQRGLLFHQEQYLHDYPFCWRAEEDPLIQYPRESWFIRTTAYKDAMLANNAKINWLPEHIQDGRFGNFLESNVDWALSRERYWGTPLPIWKCEETGKMEAVASYDELLKKPGVSGTEVWEAAKKKNADHPDDLRVHKPYIDAISYDSPFAKGARMQRVPEVIDCWYDSGAMPFAQWGYRGESPLPNPPNTTSTSLLPPLDGEGRGGVTAAQKFHAQFPADFISEAIDQTRGWFYSQLAISTLLFGEKREALEADSTSASQLAPSAYPHPFKNCIVLGLMLGEDGQKMSKSKRNYLPPSEIFDKYGADALRWYFFANQPPWTSVRYSEQAIKDSIPEFLLRLWNCYSFFVIYANIDGFDPAAEGAGGREQGAGDSDGLAFASAKSYRPLKDRNELDRWILSELNRTVAAVIERMDAYDNFAACGHITEFVDALSNWYVRRSRDRFWAADKRASEKLDAYWTLYECLVTTTKLVAPFVPFVAETMWQNLAGAFTVAGVSDPGRSRAGLTEASYSAATSVHLTDYPTGDASVVERLLSDQMAIVREIVSLGRNARMAANLKVRQPIGKVEVVLTDNMYEGWLNEHASLIKEELNVKDVVITGMIPPHVHFYVLPNLKQLGPRLGKRLPCFKEWLANEGELAGNLLNELEHHGTLSVLIGDGLGPVHVTKEDFIVRLEAESGWAATKGPNAVVILDTELTDDLLVEGLARELIRLMQDSRKNTGCEYTDRIEVGIVTESTAVRRAIEKFSDYIAQEILATKIVGSPLAEIEPVTAKVGDATLDVYVKVVR